MLSDSAILDPECPTNAWWALAEELPLAALASPLYAVLTLEDPARWLDLERRMVDVWICRIPNRWHWKKRRCLLYRYATETVHAHLPVVAGQAEADLYRPYLALLRQNANGRLTKFRHRLAIDQISNANLVLEGGEVQAMVHAPSPGIRCLTELVHLFEAPDKKDWVDALNVLHQILLYYTQAAYKTSKEQRDAVRAHERWQWNQLIEIDSQKGKNHV